MKMKRKVLIGTVVTALVLGGAFIVGASNNDDSNPLRAASDHSLNNTNKIDNEKITIEEAKTIALKEVNGEVESIELEQKLDKLLYKVKIAKDNVEYDVYIEASTGKVSSVNQDDNNDDDIVGDDDGSNIKQKDSSAVNAINTQINETISQDQAIKIAEEAVNGKMTEIKKDQDDGILQYEVELGTDRGKAEVDVDVTTGKVLKVEFDD